MSHEPEPNGMSFPHPQAWSLVPLDQKRRLFFKCVRGPGVALPSPHARDGWQALCVPDRSSCPPLDLALLRRQLSAAWPPRVQV